MQTENRNTPDSGHADMTEHLKTWNGFLAFVKWMVIANIGLLAFLAIFRTHD
jgi:hypothetical protein